MKEEGTIFLEHAKFSIIKNTIRIIKEYCLDKETENNIESEMSGTKGSKEALRNKDWKNQKFEEKT